MLVSSALQLWHKSELEIIMFQAKRSSVKLDIYRKFANALAVTAISSVAWIGYEVCVCQYVSNVRPACLLGSWVKSLSWYMLIYCLVSLADRLC